MRTGLVNEMRKLLKTHEDGLTAKFIAEKLGKDTDNVTRYLKRMPDTYIDRWEGPNRGQFSAVWCVVIPPQDCPKPTKTNLSRPVYGAPSLSALSHQL